MMQWDAILILTVAVLGLVDVWLDRWTGKGLIERACSWCDRRKHG